MPKRPVRKPMRERSTRKSDSYLIDNVSARPSDSTKTQTAFAEPSSTLPHCQLPSNRGSASLFLGFA